MVAGGYAWLQGEHALLWGGGCVCVVAGGGVCGCGGVHGPESTFGHHIR